MAYELCTDPGTGRGTHQTPVARAATAGEAPVSSIDLGGDPLFAAAASAVGQASMQGTRTAVDGCSHAADGRWRASALVRATCTGVTRPVGRRVASVAASTSWSSSRGPATNTCSDRPPDSSAARLTSHAQSRASPRSSPVSPPTRARFVGPASQVLSDHRIVRRLRASTGTTPTSVGARWHAG